MYLYLSHNPFNSPTFHFASSLSISATMRQTFRSQGLVLSLLLIFFLFSCTTSAIRLLESKEGNEEVKIHGVNQEGHSGQVNEDDAWKLMGVENCENGDVECLKRRMLADAHLDYIYTQHHKP